MIRPDWRSIPSYFSAAERTIPRLAALYPRFKGENIEVELTANVEAEPPEDQLALTLA